jgi:hypothetical protein
MPGSVVYASVPTFQAHDITAAIDKKVPLPIRLDDTTTVDVVVDVIRAVQEVEDMSEWTVKFEGIPLKDDFVTSDYLHIEGGVVGEPSLRVRAQIGMGCEDASQPETVEAQIIRPHSARHSQILFVMGPEF